MRITRLLSLFVILLLFACFPKKPEIPLTEIPSGSAVQMLEKRRELFSGLKAIVSVEIVRSGRRRVYDTVGIILDDQRRFRIEAYGPLGQSEVTLLWDGKEVILRLNDGRVVRPGKAGLEKIFGVAIEPGELCAVLSGNIPAISPSTVIRAFRDLDGSALVELTDGDIRRRVHVVYPEGSSEQGAYITDCELYRSGRLVYRAQYETMEQIERYLMPKTLRIENPAKKVLLTVVFNDTSLNVPLSEDAFTLPDAESGTQ